MTYGDDFYHPEYGEGTVISETSDAHYVRFNNPPGMSPDAPKARIVPVIRFCKAHPGRSDG